MQSQAPSYQTLAISQRGAGVAQISMNRPAVFNAFDEAMIGELDAAFAQLGAEPDLLEPRAFDERIKKEIATNAALVKASGIPISSQ